MGERGREGEREGERGERRRDGGESGGGEREGERDRERERERERALLQVECGQGDNHNLAAESQYGWKDLLPFRHTYISPSGFLSYFDILYTLI